MIYTDEDAWNNLHVATCMRAHHLELPQPYETSLNHRPL